MKIDRDKVLGSAAAGERHSRHYWPGGSDDDDVDYEALFRSFMEKLFANRGAFKVGGSLMFEFMPRANVRHEQLISPETLFCFHKFAENGNFTNDMNKNDNYHGEAIGNYHYQNASQVLGRMEEFMPVI